MMSPNVKKILLIGGAVVAGYIVYAKVIKKSPGATSQDKLALQLAAGQPAMLQKKFSAVSRFAKVAGLEEELGVSEDLGSLGGGW